MCLPPLLLFSCTSTDVGRKRNPNTPIVTVVEESTLPEDTELPSQDESPEPAHSSASETPEAGTDEPFDIITDVVLPEYEPLDLPYSEWEAVRSQELLAANGFGNTVAEWRRAAGHVDVFIRGTAYYLLDREPDPVDEALYRKGLEDSDQNVQSLVAYALIRLGDASAESTLHRIAYLDANAHLAALDAPAVVAAALLVVIVVILPDVGDVLDEEHDQDVVLVLGGVDGAAKGVAGFPKDGVDLVLANAIAQ